MTVHIDHGALARIAASAQAKAACQGAAEHIADAVRNQNITVDDLRSDGVGILINLPVEVHGAAVFLAHPAGIAVQAKYGALTRAASAVGLKVKG